MNVYLVYVVFNNTHDSATGYVSDWKKGYFPSICPLGNESEAKMFISEKAAQAFADNFAAYYKDTLLHYEIVPWQPSSK